MKSKAFKIFGGDFRIWLNRRQLTPLLLYLVGYSLSEVIWLLLHCNLWEWKKCLSIIITLGLSSWTLGTGSMNPILRATVLQYYYQLLYFFFKPLQFLFQWQCFYTSGRKSPSNISDIPKRWTSLILTLALWLEFVKGYFEYDSILVSKFTKDPTLPANHAYKKVDTWGQHNTIKLTW